MRLGYYTYNLYVGSEALSQVLVHTQQALCLLSHLPKLSSYLGFHYISDYQVKLLYAIRTNQCAHVQQ